MIWKIAKKDFLLNLMTFKFAVGTIVSVVLMAVFVPVLANDYERRLEQYNKNVAYNEGELRKVKVYKNITPTVYRPPTVLSVFSEGFEKRLGNSAKIGLDSVPTTTMSSAETNPYHSIFPTLDVSLIFKIIMSILALLVAYDVVSGEREQGTLKLMMSGNAARYQVLLGKLLAGLMALAVTVTIAFFVGLLILLLFPMVDLTQSDWARMGLVYFVTLVFVSAMYNIGLLFSCLAGRSAISLVLALFFWVLTVVVIPNAGVYLATQIRPLEAGEQTVNQRELIHQEFRSKYENIRRNRIPGEGGPQNDIGAGAFGRSFTLVASRGALERHKRQKPLLETLNMKYADKLWQVEYNYLNNLFRQKRVTDCLSRVSPISIYGNAVSVLAGTDLAASRHFMERARTYRSEVIDYIRSKTNDFSLPSYFTRCREGDWEKYERELALNEQYQQYKKAMDVAEQAGNGDEKWKIWHAMREWQARKAQIEIPSLDLQDLPQFIYEPRASNSLQRAIPDLGLLIFLNVLFFSLSFAAFARYDVR
jgi:ABC-type transport system involved in multi-copper enzyme maturation permease subunit